MSEVPSGGVPVNLGQRRSERYQPGSVEALRGAGFTFPEERAAVLALQSQHSFSGTEAIEWGQQTGLFIPGEADCAEFSPTLRCTEDCPGCPDRISLLKESVQLGTVPAHEDQGDPDVMMDRIDTLRQLGVKHVMNIGGTIDKHPNLVPYINAQRERGFVVSWFSDCIPQIEEDGSPIKGPKGLKENIDDGWILDVATHVSTDYLFGEGDSVSPELFGDRISLPPKRGRQGQFRDDPEYSRRFKSQYSAVGSRRLVEAHARRVVLNMTISHANAHLTWALYEQAVAMQDYAEQIGSPTEILFTFSPWVYRPHQARGDSPKEHPADAALRMEDMPMVNVALGAMLDDTYRRITDGKPRILANSSGYTGLHANESFSKIAVDQSVPYTYGRALVLDVEPDSTMTLDPMFKGPELAVVHSTFGYRDRTPNPEINPFTVFHGHNPLYLPNIIALRTRTEDAAQPIEFAA